MITGWMQLDLTPEGLVYDSAFTGILKWSISRFSGRMIICGKVNPTQDYLK